MQTQETKHFLDGLETTRMGRIIGPNLAERLARTCHINFGSVKIGAKATAKAAVDYAFRRGEYQNDPKAAELENTAGDPDRVLQAADRIEASAGRREGTFAERVLVTEVIELPADTDEEQRKACAKEFVADWEARGHPAAAAVHCNGLVQPHLHVLVAARPVDEAGNVDRSVRLLVGKQAVRDERHRVAGIVNEACGGEVLFHGGRHEDVGLNREDRREKGLLQRRLPRRARHRPETYTLDDAVPVLQHAAHERRREEAEELAAAMWRDRAEKSQRRTALVVDLAQRHFEDADAGRIGPADPIRLTERQRETMAKVCQKHEVAADLDDAQGQSLAFALLNLEVAKARAERARKRALAARDLPQRKSGEDENAAYWALTERAEEPSPEQEAPKMPWEPGPALKRAQQEARVAWEARRREKEEWPHGTQIFGPHRPGRPAPWQLTQREWLNEVRGQPGVPPSPDRKIAWPGVEGAGSMLRNKPAAAKMKWVPDGDKPFVGTIEWMYTKPGLIIGFPNVARNLTAVALRAHKVEVEAAIYRGDPVPEKVWAPVPRRRRRLQSRAAAVRRRRRWYGDGRTGVGDC